MAIGPLFTTDEAQALDKTDVYFYLDKYLNDVYGDIFDIHYNYAELDGSLEDFQFEMERKIKHVHIGAAAAVYGGVYEIPAQRLYELESIISGQYDYLEKLVIELEIGKQIPDGTLLHRLQMYINAAWTTKTNFEYLEAINSGYTHEENILDPKAAHCQMCLDQTALGVVPIGTLVPIGERTCIVNDRCFIEYTKQIPESRPVQVPQLASEKSAADTELQKVLKTLHSKDLIFPYETFIGVDISEFGLLTDDFFHAYIQNFDTISKENLEGMLGVELAEAEVAKLEQAIGEYAMELMQAIDPDYIPPPLPPPAAAPPAEKPPSHMPTLADMIAVDAVKAIIVGKGSVTKETLADFWGVDPKFISDEDYKEFLLTANIAFSVMEYDPIFSNLEKPEGLDALVHTGSVVQDLPPDPELSTQDYTITQLTAKSLIEPLATTLEVDLGEFMPILGQGFFHEYAKEYGDISKENVEAMLGDSITDEQFTEVSSVLYDYFTALEYAADTVIQPVAADGPPPIDESQYTYSKAQVEEIMGGMSITDTEYLKFLGGTGQGPYAEGASATTPKTDPADVLPPQTTEDEVYHHPEYGQFPSYDAFVEFEQEQYFHAVGEEMPEEDVHRLLTRNPQYAYYDDDYDGYRAFRSEHYIRWADSVTSAEEQAINYYKGSGYSGMNEFLREGGDYNDRVRNSVDNVRKAIFKSDLEEDMRLFRFTDSRSLVRWRDEAGGAENLEGAIFQDKGFLSTSTSRSTADIFGGTGDHSFHITIQAGAGTRAAYVDNLNVANSSEDEVLFLDGTEFVVQHAYQDIDGTTHLLIRTVRAEDQYGF